MIIRYTILFLTYFLCGTLLKAQNIPKLYKKHLPAIVEISVLRYDGTASSGTGFFINSKTIVTCYHVLDNVKAIEIQTSNGKNFTIDSIIASNRSNDLIKFTVKQKNDVWLKLSDKLPKVGENVFLIGNPESYNFSMSNGIVSAVRMKDSVQVIQTTAPSSSGNSGSPLLNKKGKVIGVMSYVKFIGQNLNFAATSLNVINMKDDNTIQQLLPLPEIMTKWEMDSIVNLTKSYMKARNYTDALSTILPITKFADTSQSIEFTKLIADCHFFLMDYIKAVQYYEVFIKSVYNIDKHDPNDVFTYADALHKVSICYFFLGDKDGAINNVSRAAEICRFVLERDLDTFSSDVDTTLQKEIYAMEKQIYLRKNQMDEIRKEMFTMLIQQVYVSEATYKFSQKKIFEACLSWKLAKQYGYKKDDYGFDKICE